MNPLLHYSLLLVIPTVILIHLAASPYTKVEESFNIQAIHDILTYGIPLSNSSAYLAEHYDHFTFPGSVPRTFTGALTLSAAAYPSKALGIDGPTLQFTVRALLGLANAAALLSFASAISQAFGTVASTWYILLQSTQFHVLYYASRTLPNSFALPLTTFALRNLLLAAFGPKPKRNRRARIALMLLTAAGVLLRSEIALLVAMHSAALFLSSPATLRTVILPAGILAATLALLLTVTVDSYFWSAFPLWPEWAAFRYNTLEGHSADWGTSPWHFYFSAALPKLLLNPATSSLCIPAALYNGKTRAFCLGSLAPLLAFVAAYSALPHKEWRFVIYAVPGLTGVGAAGAAYLWQRRTRSALGMLLAGALVASVLLSALASSALLLVSSLNYPGGAALTALHAAADGAGEAGGRVFLDNLSCQTGVTRFLQREPPWVYDKSEDEEVRSTAAFWAQFDYVLVERPETVLGEWELVADVRAYGGVSLVRGESLWRVLAPHATPGSLLVGVLALLDRGEDWLTTHVTRGKWPRIQMERRISILKRRVSIED